MTDITGAFGAKRASWKPNNTRSTFEQIIRDNPKTSRAELSDIYRETIEADPDLLRVDLEYCFDNHWLAWEHKRHRTRSVGRPKVNYQKGETSPEVTAIAQTITSRLVLMSLTMPNGKRLGECTGTDLKQIGGFWRTLAREVGPRQLVSTVFTEDELRARWEKQ